MFKSGYISLAFIALTGVMTAGCAATNDDEPDVGQDEAAATQSDKSSLRVPAGTKTRLLGIETWKVNDLLGSLKVSGRGSDGKKLVSFTFDAAVISKNRLEAHVTSPTGRGLDIVVTKEAITIVRQTLTPFERSAWEAFSEDLKAAYPDGASKGAGDACSVAMEYYGWCMASLAVAVASALLPNPISPFAIIVAAGVAGNAKRAMDLACNTQ